MGLMINEQYFAHISKYYFIDINKMVAQHSANSPKIKRKKIGMMKSIEQVSVEMMTNKSGCISM